MIALDHDRPAARRAAGATEPAKLRRDLARRRLSPGHAGDGGHGLAATPRRLAADPHDSVRGIGSAALLLRGGFFGLVPAARPVLRPVGRIDDPAAHCPPGAPAGFGGAPVLMAIERTIASSASSGGVKSAGARASM